MYKIVHLSIASRSLCRDSTGPVRYVQLFPNFEGVGVSNNYECSRSSCRDSMPPVQYVQLFPNCDDVAVSNVDDVNTLFFISCHHHERPKRKVYLGPK